MIISESHIQHIKEIFEAESRGVLEISGTERRTPTTPEPLKIHGN